MGFFLFDSVSRMVRGRRRKKRLRAAAVWPTISATLLPSALVMKDDLAEGTAVQDSQVECPYYFSIAEGYLGGHVRSVACSDSEGRRIQRALAEETPITVRYNPQNPDECCVLQIDNEGALPFTVWPG
jgi:hypothetical protein